MAKKKSTIIYEGAEKPTAPKERHYVDNVKFYEALVEYRAKCVAWEAEGKEGKPRVPEYIGECFLKIARNLVTKKNWRGNAHYADELVSDAVKNCITAVHSFNPEASKNPFSYFTQTCFYAFLRRIEIEKDETYVRFRCMKEAIALGETADVGDYHTEAMSHLDNMQVSNEFIDDFIVTFEKKHKIGMGTVKRKRAKKTSGALGELFSEEEPKNE